MTKKKLLQPNPSRLIEGLRDTGYDFNTALADIVDNSIDAGSNSISIKIQRDVDGEVLVTVADDGCGMDEKTLLDGMRYGAQGKPDPCRLGKFGLGLKTASTAFCRKLSVVTRPSQNGTLLKATWDLDHVCKIGKWELLLPKPKTEELDLLNEVASGSSGTLVIWDQVDRLLKNYKDPAGSHALNALNKIVDGFRLHAEMIYQRFINAKDKRARNVKMTLNGEELQPWSPFCESESETEVVGDETIPVELPDKRKGTFTIRAFVLPRKEQFSSPKEHKKARLTNAMQGIYIYRENRLIHAADWLGMFSKEPHFTLLRVEFSFDHLLDDAFQVDIKKSRILLDQELYDFVYKKFIPPPRTAAEQRYRQGTKKITAKKAKDAHADSNSGIGSKEQDLKISDIKITNAKKSEVEVSNRKGTVRLKLKLGNETPEGQIHVQAVDQIDDGLLWAPALIDQHHAVQINTSHSYYHKVYVPNHVSSVTMQGMDSLLWALAEAELGTITDASRDLFHDLRYEVSRLLRKLVDDLPDPVLSEEDK